jgi:hypothetical protein
VNHLADDKSRNCLDLPAPTQWKHLFYLTAHLNSNLGNAEDFKLGRDANITSDLTFTFQGNVQFHSSKWRLENVEFEGFTLPINNNGLGQPR